MIYCAIASFLLYCAGFILGVLPKTKSSLPFRILSGSLLGVGLLAFAIFGSIGFARIYANDKTFLAILAVVFASLALLLLPFYAYFKTSRPKLSSVLLGFLFVLGVAFLISMIALSQDAMIRDEINQTSQI